MALLLMAVKSMIEDDDVLVLTSAISSKAIDANTKHTIRLYSTISDYLPPAIRWMKDKMPGERVVLFYPNDESGWDFSKLTAELMTKVGYKVISTELVDRAARDFQAQLTRIIATNPDIIDLGPHAPATAGLIVRQARELGYKKAFSVLGGSGAAGIVAAAGAAEAEGLLHVIYADPDHENFKRLAERYRQKIGQAPNEAIAPFYDGARALMKAMALADNPNDPQQVRKVFAQAFPMLSMLGEPLSFGGKERLGIDAQIMTANYIALMKGGKSVVVGVAR
jgi:branched-chain amino acid transport system substrate-binding protein